MRGPRPRQPLLSFPLVGMGVSREVLPVDHSPGSLVSTTPDIGPGLLREVTCIPWSWHRGFTSKTRGFSIKMVAWGHLQVSPQPTSTLKPQIALQIGSLQKTDLAEVPPSMNTFPSHIIPGRESQGCNRAPAIRGEVLCPRASL